MGRDAGDKLPPPAIPTGTLFLGPGKLDRNCRSSLPQEAKLVGDAYDNPRKPVPLPHSTIVAAGRCAAAPCRSPSGQAARQSSSRSLRPPFHENIVLETLAHSSCTERRWLQSTQPINPRLRCLSRRRLAPRRCREISVQARQALRSRTRVYSQERPKASKSPEATSAT